LTTVLGHRADESDPDACIVLIRRDGRRCSSRSNPVHAAVRFYYRLID